MIFAQSSITAPGCVLDGAGASGCVAEVRPAARLQAPQMHHQPDHGGPLKFLDLLQSLSRDLGRTQNPINANAFGGVPPC